MKIDFSHIVSAQLAARGLRFDANETAAFSRELEYVHAEVIAAKYPEYKWRSIVPVKTGAPLGATSHRWFEVDGFGSAKWLDNLATEEFPTAEVKGDEQTGKIRSMGAKYIVTVEELRAAAMMRTNVETEKQKLVRRSIEAQFDKAVFGTATGTNGGFKGIAHDDNSTEYTPDATYGSNGNWFTVSNAGTPEKIIHDIRGMVEAAKTATKNAFEQYDLFLCPELSYLLDRPMSVLINSVRTNLLQSTAKYALESIRGLRSITMDLHRLSGAGTSSKHRVLLFPREPEVVDAFVPLEFEQFAPQLSGMAFVTHCHAKYGGIRVKHPAAVQCMDSATS
jgi:hypothetical protein